MKHPNFIPSRFCLPLLAALLASFPFAATSQAQSTAYVFTKIIDDETVRPDNQTDFYIGSVDSFPSLDGNTVLFQDITNGANSLWSASSRGNAQGLVKIADFQTAVPGGVGTFTRFDDQTARVQEGVILFEGLDSNTAAQTHGGLYTVPAGGGTITKIFDYNTTAPESGYPFYQSNANNEITAGVVSEGDYDLENGIVAFHAITDGDANHDNADGIYTIHLDGTGITYLANRSNDATPPPFPVNQYYSVVLHGGTAVFYGATVFDPYGVFSSPETGGLSAPAELATPYTALPGGQSPEMTTNYYTGYDHFDHVTGDLIFAAHDGSGVNGLYRLPAGGLGSGEFTTVVDNHTVLPGSATPPAYLDGAPFSADGGQVAFVTPGDTSALYVTNADGSFTRIVGVGDVLDGITLTSVDLGAHALSGGRIAFAAGSYLGGHDGNARYGAIFVATPASQIPTVTIADAGDGKAEEGGAAGKAVVRRTGDLSSALTVRYKTKGSAKAGTDFKKLSGTVIIPAGVAQAKIKVKPIDDQTVDGTRKAKIMLLPSLDGSYQLGTADLAVIKVIDND